MRVRLTDNFRVSHRSRDYLFIVKNAAILELEPPLAGFLEAVAAGAASPGGGLLEEEVHRLAAEAFGEDAPEVIGEIAAFQLFEPAGPGAADPFIRLNPFLGRDPERPVALQNFTAHITQDCNLRCTYCYADHGLYGAGERKLMPAEMARDYLDLLFRESGDRRSLHFTFFGGEPLMNFPVIEAAVAHARERTAETGKQVRFSLTTNGTLLDGERTRFILENDIAVTVSLDGPPEVNDAARPRASGSGSYALTMARVRPLLAARPTPARVTLTRRCLDVERIVEHLLGEGFSDVGVTPAATLHPDLRITGADWEVLGDHMERAVDRYLTEALSGRYHGFTNATNVLRQFREGASRGYPCGAGAGLLAGNASGEIYACHRNVNDPRFALGSLGGGVDRARQRDLLAKVHVSKKPHCEKCWLRSLCGGGCYHVGSQLGGSVDSAPEEMCDWIRRWYGKCLRVYLTLLEERPGFLDRISGRGGDGGKAGIPAGTVEPQLNPLID